MIFLQEKTDPVPLAEGPLCSSQAYGNVRAGDTQSLSQQRTGGIFAPSSCPQHCPEAPPRGCLFLSTGGQSLGFLLLC